MALLAESGIARLERRAQTSPLVVPAQTAILRARLARPTTGSPISWDGTLRVRLVLEVDGVEYFVAGEVSGGVWKNRDGIEIPEYVLTWQVPTGYYHPDQRVPRAEWANIKPQRIGETAKSGLRAWVDVSNVRGDTATSVVLEGIELAPPTNKDPGWDYHESIAYQNATSTTETAGDAALSMSFTAGAGTDRVALVSGGSGRTVANTAFALDYGGVTPTSLWSASEGTYARGVGGYVLDASIASGAKTIAGTGSGGSGTYDGSVLGVVSLTGVSQSTPVGTPGTDTGAHGVGGNPSVTVGSVAATDMLVDGIYEYGAIGTIGANQTARVDNDGGDIVIRMSTQSGVDGGVMSHTRDASNGEYVLGAVAFKEAAAAAATSLPPMSVPTRATRALLRR